MIKRLTLIAILAFAAAFIAAKIIHTNKQGISAQTSYSIIAKNKTAIRCSPDWESLKDFLEAVEIPLIQGAGTYTWKISTKNDSAQRYFNQGINMYYSFHVIEAMASFKKATNFDPGCAMLYWAQALSFGPNINDLGYAASPEALKATQMAVRLAGKASRMEKAMIDAMAVRYTADSADATRAKLNLAYTAMMKKVYNAFPSNADARALYADALMLEHPWDLWYLDGKPKPWTPLIEKVLEKLLVSNVEHPGANHYYIHVMEGSPFAAKALPSAKRLGKLTPGLSHTVHMPAHIFLRTGQYNEGVLVNENAVNSYKNELPVYGPASGGNFLYLIHNLHMQTNLAMLAGRSAYCIQTAWETAKSIPADYLSAPAPFGAASQYVYMVPTLVYIHFGKWNELLAANEPDQKLVYANILYHFGRGMAFAHQTKTSDARNELLQMQMLMKDSGLYLPFGIFSPAIDGARVAEHLLKGSIWLAEKKYPAALEAFTKAATVEEHMVYTEPRDWLLNPKHYLGNALMAAGKPLDAQNVFEKDLLNNKENGWALFGIYQSLLAQKKNGAAEKMLERFNKAFSKSDVKIPGPVF